MLHIWLSGCSFQRAAAAVAGCIIRQLAGTVPSCSCWDTGDLLLVCSAR